MLVQLDRFLHDRVFNPLARQIQKWLHVNRYHLLFGSEIVSEVLFFVTMVIGTGYWFMIHRRVSDMAMCTFGILMAVDTLRSGVAARRVAAMREAAARFEDRGFVVAPVELILLSRTRKTGRVYWNVTYLGMLAITFLVAFGINLDWVSVAFCTSFANRLLNLHLWDVNDLDPRDREYLFKQESQTSST